MNDDKQQFHRGDVVRVAKDLGAFMSHFEADCDAIVLGSYADEYGGSNHDSFSLFIKDRGPVAWYYSRQLTLIESGRLDMLTAWEDAAQAEQVKKSDLDWIFSNGSEVVAHPHGASIAALARCMGLDNLWGSHGEGITYYENAKATLMLATPYLLSGDKDGWLHACRDA